MQRVSEWGEPSPTGWHRRLAIPTQSMGSKRLDTHTRHASASATVGNRRLPNTPAAATATRLLGRGVVMRRASGACQGLARSRKRVTAGWIGKNVNLPLAAWSVAPRQPPRPRTMWPTKHNASAVPQQGHHGGAAVDERTREQQVPCERRHPSRTHKETRRQVYNRANAASRDVADRSTPAQQHITKHRHDSVAASRLWTTAVTASRRRLIAMCSPP